MLTRRSLLIATPGLSARPDRPMMQVHAADRFVDSVGVCTHLESPPYRSLFDEVLRQLTSLGVRHVRDELRPSNDLARWRRLSMQTGIKLHLLVSPATNTVAEMVAFLAALAPGAVSAVEGQNEGDSAWFRAQPCARPGWAAVVIDYQRAVFRALRGDGPFAAIPVVSPSVLDYRPEDMLLLRPAAPFCDVVALHPYLQGAQEPETEADDAAIGWYLRRMRDPFKPGAPAMATETGYASGGAGLSLRAAGIYLPRLLLHLFDRGIVRSFLYELMDQGRGGDDPELHYGLLHVDGAPKPAFDALRLLIGALADPGPDVTPPPMALSVAGPADVRVLAFAKRRGEIVLAVWRATRVWHPARRRDLFPPAATAQLRAGDAPPLRHAATLRLEAGATWSAAPLRRGRLDLEISDTVTLVRLSG